MRIIVIGAGASGLMAALEAAKGGHEVWILEKNEKAGKKIYITGKGRCNVTNNCDVNNFIKNVITNPKFLFSALNKFKPSDTMNFFESHKTPLVIERGNRVYPQSYKASDITKCLVEECLKYKVRILYKNEVKDIQYKDGKFIVSIMYNQASYNQMSCDKLVVATGGLSYPSTGSNGQGHNYLKKLGHTITPLLPALIRIECRDAFLRELDGLNLKNVELTALTPSKKYSFFGELDFYDKGIEGPISLKLSSYLNKCKENIELFIDLKTALNEDQLDARLLKEFNNDKNASLKKIMKELLPHKLVNPFISVSRLDGEKLVNSITSNERKVIINYLKKFPLRYGKLDSLERAVVTCGGVDVKEINPRTMESKIISGLYIVGELIDVDALTGGFNLQIAFSTGYSAGTAIAELE